MADHEPSDQPIINIIGEKVALGPHRRELLPLYHKWINDFEVTRTLAVGMQPMTWEGEEAWYQRTSQPGDHDILFTIYQRESLRPIGNTGLHRIDHQHRTAEFGILIGEKDCWDKGYGTEVARLMLEYGFTALSLHSIMLRAYSFNQRGLRAYTRAGFKLIGRRREARRFAGVAYDEVLMDCLATEFQGQTLAHLLPEA
ncbi:MAG: GNAT family N-acetyltransferase [Chloroflexi bacterium]|nr:GNAT family N-acetyltransferase [Chloroflexota bacterium]